MSDWFEKLNTLVRSTVHDVLSDQSSIEPARRPKMNKNVEKDIETLRQRINEAIEYEDDLQEQVNGLETAIGSLDQQADDAVEVGNEEQARHIIAQIQRTKQRLHMAQSDLDAHRLVAQELIQNVNLLEASVAETRRTEQAESDLAVEDATNALDKISIVMNAAHERIAASVNDVLKSKENAQAEPTLADFDEVDDDLSARRDRLSRR